MERTDWLMLLLGFKGVDGPALDPVRVQKSMFLFSREVADVDGRYEFQPYNYGPYSFELRDDLDRLVAQGLVTAEPVPGYTWGRYKLTAAGLDKARQVRSRAPREVAHQLFEIKQSVTGKSFNKLLREVYDDYPDFAANSIFRR